MLPYPLPQRNRALVLLHVDSLICVSDGDINVGGSSRMIIAFRAKGVVFAANVSIRRYGVGFGHVDRRSSRQLMNMHRGWSKKETPWLFIPLPINTRAAHISMLRLSACRSYLWIHVELPQAGVVHRLIDAAVDLKS